MTKPYCYRYDKIIQYRELIKETNDEWIFAHAQYAICATPPLPSYDACNFSISPKKIFFFVDIVFKLRTLYRSWIMKNIKLLQFDAIWTKLERMKKKKQLKIPRKISMRACMNLFVFFFSSFLIRSRKGIFARVSNIIYLFSFFFFFFRNDFHKGNIHF